MGDSARKLYYLTSGHHGNPCIMSRGITSNSISQKSRQDNNTIIFEMRSFTNVYGVWYPDTSVTSGNWNWPHMGINDRNSVIWHQILMRNELWTLGITRAQIDRKPRDWWSDGHQISNVRLYTWQDGDLVIIWHKSVNASTDLQLGRVEPLTMRDRKVNHETVRWCHLVNMLTAARLFVIVPAARF